jgi:hypothetical protein
VPRVRFAPPPDHKPLGYRLRLVDFALGHRRLAQAARRLGDERKGHHRSARHVFPGLLVGDVDELSEPPVGREHRERALHVHADVAGMDRHRKRLGGRQARVERPVDQQAPHVAVVDLADQVLDVETSVAQRAARLVRFRDLGLEGDHALQTRLEVALLLVHSLVHSSRHEAVFGY